MAGNEADKAAILAAIRAETAAWLQRDFEGLRIHWLHSPQARRMEYYGSLGVRTNEGWDAIAKRLKTIIERFPEKRAFADHIRWENVNVVVEETIVWVTYDQIGLDGGEDLKQELKILHRVEWNSEWREIDFDEGMDRWRGKAKDLEVARPENPQSVAAPR
ncbi:hypothetical protein J2735_000015 [Agrobacterium tumefaciens]|nr:hypothetical protein [Agrobacterium tumefaciens]MDR6586880.1 hypothetical protein [Agrobacterium tumefaciens]